MTEPSPATMELSRLDVREMIHELRNSFFGLRMGLEVLPQVRGDAAAFDKVWQRLRDEERRAAERLEEFARLCAKGPKT